MFPCEMARYIAGFSPEARKLGRFRRAWGAGIEALRRKQARHPALKFGRGRHSKQGKPRRIDAAGLSPHGVANTPLRRETEIYFSELLIEVNCVLRLVPRPLTTAIIASAIPAAIRPYSIAGTPDSSDKKIHKVRFNNASFGFSCWLVRHPK